MKANAMRCYYHFAVSRLFLLSSLDPNSKTGAFLPGYDGEVHWGPLSWLCSDSASALLCCQLVSCVANENFSSEQVLRSLVTGNLEHHKFVGPG